MSALLSWQVQGSAARCRGAHPDQSWFSAGHRQTRCAFPLAPADGLLTSFHYGHVVLCAWCRLPRCAQVGSRLHSALGRLGLLAAGAPPLVVPRIGMCFRAVPAGGAADWDVFSCRRVARMRRSHVHGARRRLGLLAADASELGFRV